MINVIWWGQSRGNWDCGLLLSIFEKHPSVFSQVNSKELFPTNRAIVIVVGKPEIAPLREYLETLNSGIVILTSDEDAYFDWVAAIPMHLEVWTQYYTRDRSAITERLLIGTPNRIKDYKINLTTKKKYLWSFVGQVQNPFRQECVEVLQELPGGFLQVAELFGGNGKNGMEYQEYLDIMCQSHFVICPAGSMSVDSFRLYEAIECGAIPITDKRAPREPMGYDWWADVVPFNTILKVNKWSELKSFIERVTDRKELDYILSLNNNEWWFTYKQELEKKLLYAAKK